MKKSLLIGLILSASTAVSANELSKQNLVERSLTLKDSEVALSGGLYFGETDDEDDTGLGLNAAYGLTDELTIHLGGVRYKYLPRYNDGKGLELTFGAGYKGHMERNNDDVKGYGADITGKYVFSRDLAMVFAAEYVFWNNPGSDNSSENRFSVGALYQPIERLTFSVDYTHRDLKDFVQNNAYTASAGVNYALTKNTDIGLTYAYSDFDAEQNGYDIDSAYQRNYGAYINYRF